MSNPNTKLKRKQDKKQTIKWFVRVCSVHNLPVQPKNKDLIRIILSDSSCKKKYKIKSSTLLFSKAEFYEFDTYADPYEHTFNVELHIHHSDEFFHKNEAVGSTKISLKNLTQDKEQIRWVILQTKQRACKPIVQLGITAKTFSSPLQPKAIAPSECVYEVLDDSTILFADPSTLVLHDDPKKSTSKRSHSRREARRPKSNNDDSIQPCVEPRVCKVEFGLRRTESVYFHDKYTFKVTPLTDQRSNLCVSPPTCISEETKISGTITDISQELNSERILLCTCDNGRIYSWRTRYKDITQPVTSTKFKEYTRIFTAFDGWDKIWSELHCMVLFENGKTHKELSTKIQKNKKKNSSNVTPSDYHSFNVKIITTEPNPDKDNKELSNPENKLSPNIKKKTEKKPSSNPKKTRATPSTVSVREKDKNSKSQKFLHPDNTFSIAMNEVNEKKQKFLNSSPISARSNTSSSDLSSSIGNSSANENVLQTSEQSLVCTLSNYEILVWELRFKTQPMSPALEQKDQVDQLSTTPSINYNNRTFSGKCIELNKRSSGNFVLDKLPRDGSKGCFKYMIKGNLPSYLSLNRETGKYTLKNSISPSNLSIFVLGEDSRGSFIKKYREVEGHIVVRDLSGTPVKPVLLTCMVLVDDEALFVGDSVGNVYVWDVRNVGSGEQHPVKVMEGHKGTVTSLSRWNEKVVSGGIDGTIRVWDVVQFDDAKQEEDKDKKDVSDKREICPFDAWKEGCVRTNQDHFKKFRHPNREKKLAETASTALSESSSPSKADGQNSLHPTNSAIPSSLDIFSSRIPTSSRSRISTAPVSPTPVITVNSTVESQKKWRPVEARQGQIDRLSRVAALTRENGTRANVGQKANKLAKIFRVAETPSRPIKENDEAPTEACSKPKPPLLSSVTCLVQHGTYLYSGHENGFVSRWYLNVESGEKTYDLYWKAHNLAVACLKVTAGKLWSAGRDGQVHVWQSEN